jgi:predicted HD superfamily hydrolase involved in NAD metabolism
MLYETEDYYEVARRRLETRLNDYRFLHSICVADTAVSMAECYHADKAQARIAGLLHDWDKNLSDEELLERMEQFEIEPLNRQEDMANLLHARTGAVAVSQEFPELPSAVIQAISRHTSAATDMSDLDMIIYVADMIEPLRSLGNLTVLRALVGRVPLQTLFFKAYEATMMHLISRNRFIHPDSIDVWNTYVALERESNHYAHDKPNMPQPLAMKETM